MRLTIFPWIATILMLSCKVQKHANTVAKDDDNPCIIQMVIQLGIEGTHTDVAVIRDQVEPCFERECFVPCPNDSTKGCKVIMNVIVKKWDSVSLDEMESFHHVFMVDDDGLPSNAQIGELNGKNARGTWRRNAHYHTYCHEVLHFLGLPDKYCSRLYNAADSTAMVENICDPPPDPNGNCCVPDSLRTRCSSPCHGHENDLMGALEPGLSCHNIVDALSKGNLNKCPDECCESGTAFQRPPETALGPSYLYFNDKNFEFGSFGGKIDYTYPLGNKMGITIDGGAHIHIDKEGEYKQSIGQFTIGGGVTYWPKFFGSDSKLDVSLHGLGGIMHHRTKTEFGNQPAHKTKETSPLINLGVKLSYKLSRTFSFRILQLDYIPTFFGDQTQSNYRISAGLTYHGK